MINLLKQAIAFITINIVQGQFKYLFLVLNIIPIFLYLFFEFSLHDLIGYFIIETIVYCLFNILLIKYGVLLTKVISIGIVCLLIYFTFTDWVSTSESHLTSRQISFFNFTVIILTSYLITLFFNQESIYELDEKTFKKNVVVKFVILFFVAILGAIMTRLIENEIAYLLVLVITKIIVDTLTIIRPAKLSN